MRASLSWYYEKFSCRDDRNDPGTKEKNRILWLRFRWEEKNVKASNSSFSGDFNVRVRAHFYVLREIGERERDRERKRERESYRLALLARALAAFPKFLSRHHVRERERERKVCARQEKTPLKKEIPRSLAAGTNQGLAVVSIPASQADLRRRALLG